MKKEQIALMIGEAPDRYVKDAGEPKRWISRYGRWLGGIAAVLALAVLVNGTLGILFSVSAEAVSTASAARVTARPDYDSEEFEAWRAEWNVRNERADSAKSSISHFAAKCSREVMENMGDGNLVWSPLNAYIALAMTAELTDGETRREVMQVLAADDLSELRSRISAVWETVYENDGKEISVLANSLWLDNDVEYVQETMDILAYDYYASVYRGELGSEQTNRAMTNWMKEQTGGFLKDRTGTVQLEPEDQLLTIASTVYFQSQWADQFQRKNHTQAVFHANAGDVECTFMNQKECEMYYYWAEDFGAVQMRLENGSGMWLILPDEDKTVADVLAGDEYMQLITGDTDDSGISSKWMKVNLSVPQFDISSGVDLKGALQNMGLTKIFEKLGNDFSSSITSDTPVYLDSIYQDTRVAIDEKGVTAASYIELNFGAGAPEPPDEVMDFVLDRPFVFVISKSEMPLFVGTVNMP